MAEELPWILQIAHLHGLLFILLSFLYQVAMVTGDNGDCQVGGRTYSRGESFNISCRERCLCLGTQYGCIQACPEEDRVPMEDCKEPRLIEVPGQCCKTWICAGNVNTGDEDKNNKDKPGGNVGPKAKCPFSVVTHPWSECSKTCGIGVRSRIVSDTNCEMRTESKLCQVHPCHDETKR